MNRRDDHAGSLFVTDPCEEGRNRAYGPEQGFVAGKGASEGAAAFMNNPS